MNRLVQETGFAKGTLYLYFTTRHEILASLFVQMLTAWHHRLGKSLSKARNYDEFCARYMRELTYESLVSAHACAGTARSGNGFAR